ncbi:hypothetical protein RJT34_27857 [Clitoria ternatea]|uniref:Uncharacterized protein n=1 Tax=Clitoria ternatea TaxID=43366 RepID=A0AAN9FDB7_CLITE
MVDAIKKNNGVIDIYFDNDGMEISNIGDGSSIPKEEGTLTKRIKEMAILSEGVVHLDDDDDDDDDVVLDYVEVKEVIIRGNTTMIEDIIEDTTEGNVSEVVDGGYC